MSKCPLVRQIWENDKHDKYFFLLSFDLIVEEKVTKKIENVNKEIDIDELFVDYPVAVI